MKASITIVVAFEDGGERPADAPVEMHVVSVNISGRAEGDAIGPGLHEMCEDLITLVGIGVRAQLEMRSEAPVVTQGEVAH